MRFRTIATVLGVTFLAAGWSTAKESPADKREKIRKMSSQTLTDLYKLHPAARGAVQQSAGYAVFSNLGVNLLLVSTAHGGGLAVNSKTKQETFMKMVSAGVGVGVGVKDFRAVFVFETEKALTQFINSGWEGSGQADAAAKAGKTGGAYSGATALAPGVWVYQITKSGLALQATLQGTKYYKDDDLNNVNSRSQDIHGQSTLPLALINPSQLMAVFCRSPNQLLLDYMCTDLGSTVSHATINEQNRDLTACIEVATFNESSRMRGNP